MEDTTVRFLFSSSAKDSTQSVNWDHLLLNQCWYKYSEQQTNLTFDHFSLPTFNAWLLILGHFNQNTGQAQSMQASYDMQVRLTGTTGISWRKKPDTVSKTVCEREYLLQIPSTVQEKHSLLLSVIFASFTKKKKNPF